MTAIVRGRFRLKPGAPVELIRQPLLTPEVEAEDRSERADAMVEEAEYLLAQGHLDADKFAEDDEERSGALVYASDFAEFKVKAEVLVRANCYPPYGRPVAECKVKASLGDWSKELLVVGPRAWVDRILGGKATDPLAFTMMPLDYSHAYGGPDFPHNPAGKGASSEQLPNVEDPAHPVHRSTQHPMPAGFGPINPAWPLRAPKVGKNYGKEYQKTREPYYASDFDPTYLNAAPLDQQFDKPLRGDERLRFHNMHPESADFGATLPGIAPRVFIMKSDETVAEARMVLDTVYADLIDEELLLTWRGLTPIGEDDLSDVLFALVAEEKLGERLPAAHYEELLRQFAADPTGFEASPAAAVAQLADDLESGALEARVDAMGPDEEPVSTLMGGAMAGSAPPDAANEFTTTLGDGIKQGTKGNPGAKQAIRDQLKAGLRMARSGGGGGMAIKPSGAVNFGLVPMLRKAFAAIGPVARQASDAGMSVGEYTNQLEDQLAAVQLEEIQQRKGKLTVAEGQKPPEQPGPNRDLSGQDFTDRDLSGMDLSGSNFEGSILTRAKLTGAYLAGANLGMSVLAETDLSDADCSDADFSLCQFMKTNARGARFSRATLDQCVYLRANFSGADLSEAVGFTTIAQKSVFDGACFNKAQIEFSHFDGCELNEVDFSEANLKRTMFRESKLHGARFDRADLSSGGYLNSDLSRARFFRSKCDTTSWLNAILTEADFSYAALPASMFMNVQAKRAKFIACDMPEVRFYRAILREAMFDKANMFQVDLRKASLTKASFAAANLYLGTFIEAFGTDVNLKGANVKMANFKRNKMVIAK